MKDSLEIFRCENPFTSREKLQHKETNENFLLNSNHESWLEENEHKEVN